MGASMKGGAGSLTGATLLLLGACGAKGAPHSAILECGSPHDAGAFIGLYSLERGQLPVPPVASEDVDLVYYFDSNDCQHGALLGADDRPGYLFPIGHRRWEELLALEPPSADAPSVRAIVPLTADEEGLAFWLRTGVGELVLVRLVRVPETSHADLVIGMRPRLELQWLPPAGEPH